MDQSDDRGQFLLNGSANFLTVPHITESLAGRAVFLTMLPLSQGEIASASDGLLDLSFTEQSRLLDLGSSPLGMEDYLELICRAGFQKRYGAHRGAPVSAGSAVTCLRSPPVISLALRMSATWISSPSCCVCSRRALRVST